MIFVVFKHKADSWVCVCVCVCVCVSCMWKQWRNKLRGQQYEREKELSDHAVVIKELQKVIGNERIAKEQLENQVWHDK